MNILDRRPPKADHRLPYGNLPMQFGDLWLPASASAAHRSPLLVFLHGGWWKSAYDLGYASFLCAAMKAQGVAVWSLEYRRVGDDGGGWPGTMQDVAAGMDHVVKLAEAFPLDATRAIAAGHSAGGQLGVLAGWASPYSAQQRACGAGPKPRVEGSCRVGGIGRSEADD